MASTEAEKRQDIDIEKVLLKIWLNKNSFDSRLYDVLIGGGGGSVKGLSTLSLTAQAIVDCDWAQFDQSSTNKQAFEKAFLALKDEPIASIIDIRQSIKKGQKPRPKTYIKNRPGYEHIQVNGNVEFRRHIACNEGCRHPTNMQRMSAARPKSMMPQRYQETSMVPSMKNSMSRAPRAMRSCNNAMVTSKSSAPRRAMRSSNHSAGGRGGRSTKGNMPTNKSSTSTSSKKKLGFQAGGEQGIVGFRKNVKAGRMPQIESISYEGIFSDYYFDTESNQAGQEIDDDDDDHDHVDDDDGNHQISECNNDGRSQHWICVRCTFKNHPLLNKCEICETMREISDNIADGQQLLSPQQLSSSKSTTKTTATMMQRTDENISGVRNSVVAAREEHELGLFYPSYCYAKTAVPSALIRASRLSSSSSSSSSTANIAINKEMVEDEFGDIDNVSDVYMTVGLNSNITEADFERKKLNLVIVLDISGSMRKQFDDRSTNTNTSHSSHNHLSKMTVAEKCTLAVVSHLNADDRFGFVLFNHCAYTVLALKKLSETTMNEFRSILQYKAWGGTNFEAGYETGLSLYDDRAIINTGTADLYDNRMIYLTDACPGVGKTDAKSLMQLAKRSATQPGIGKKIYPTFVGVGLDFNSNLIHEISQIRGANYLVVQSNADFIRKMDDEFDFIVSPLVFNLCLRLHCEADDGETSIIEAVYGSNSVDHNTGEVMRINSLFPSPMNDDGETKGGIVLIKLKASENGYRSLVISCEYEDKYGKKFHNKQAVDFGIASQVNGEHFDNMGVRKGVLLTRFVLLMKAWLGSSPGKGRRGGGSIVVDPKFKMAMTSFRTYFEREMDILGDSSLKQEIEILDLLIAA